ncbi:MAG: hypothetical protein WCS17_04070 [Prevotella sp.]
MNEELLKRIIAQQAILLKRLERLEDKVNNGFHSRPYQSYIEELKREANKIINQIEI